ncbi:MAG: MotA/TolQ/ExbB proton channel family protein [Phycisphaerales bacterium]
MTHVGNHVQPPFAYAGRSMFDSIIELVERGGIVMYPLLGLSVVSLALILERALFWLRTNGSAGRREWNRLANAAAKPGGDREAIAARAKAGRTIYSRIALQLTQPENASSSAPHAAPLLAADEARVAVERFMTILSTIITAAPLLGILGTVFGIIQSFDLLGQADDALRDPRAVSGGIAEALITTATGLAIALLTLFPYMIFKAQVERTLDRLESLINLLSTRAA